MKAQAFSRDNNKYRSGLEQRYAGYLQQRFLLKEIVKWQFEALKFRLANNTFYTPDFYVLLPDGRIELHEVKGFVRAAGRIKFKTAAAQYPEFCWLWITYDKRTGWKRETL